MIHWLILMLVFAEWCLVCVILSSVTSIVQSPLFSEFQLYSGNGQVKSNEINSDAFLLQNTGFIILSIWFILTFLIWFRYFWLLIVQRVVYFMRQNQSKISKAKKSLNKSQIYELDQSWRQPSKFGSSVFLILCLIRLILAVLYGFILVQNSNLLSKTISTVSYQSEQTLSEPASVIVPQLQSLLDQMFYVFSIAIIQVIIIGIIQLWGSWFRLGYSYAYDKMKKIQ